MAVPAYDASKRLGHRNPTPDFEACTKSDTLAQTINGHYPQAVYCGGAGNLLIVNRAGTVVTIAVVAGTLLEMEYIGIMSTNTTATSIVKLG